MGIHEIYQPATTLSVAKVFQFEAILALSQGTKWRLDGLMAAASITGLKIQVPAQPGWSDQFTHAFQDFGPSSDLGAARAYMAHVDLLKLAVANRYSSTFIMEDDIDWDVRIRQQMRGVASGIQELSRKKWSLSVSSKKSESRSPYGDNWDVLWLGHCSDPPKAECELEIVSYADDTVVPWDKYRGIDPHMKEVLKEGTRSVHRTCSAICSFAYAVSAKGARKVLDIAMTGRDGAFDLMLHFACNDGRLDCISVNPELFDPYKPPGGQISEVAALDNEKENGKVESFGQGISNEMGSTDNILESARCKALWDTTCLGG
ncbi:glycosyltransferase family 25 protein [Lophiostoma macrostomum CBS 122681]|uniref:Glycosyltransferase family 25 protein n=1 Tax=Lophiostoma macrostomum CBS 122681 TaxID=1314788 RepID=A0A6A6T8F6_9PLEO|nr:glycosyltransferase family 25 protein [Lophiostoma macrostomum CBS 122681]